MILWSLFMLWMILIQNINGTVTQVPSHACVGEQITVECSLTVPDPNNNFRTNFIRFIVGSSDISISDSSVNSLTGDYGGVDLTRLTAFANNSFSGDKIIRGSITLSNYTASDAGIRLGCAAIYYLSGIDGATDIFRETTLLISAAPPPAPSMLSISSNIDPNTCSATVSLNWIPPSSTDRTVDLYYLSLQNGTALDSISAPANSYSHNTTLLLDTVYAYSVSASSCAGNSTAATSNINLIGYSLNDTSPNLTCLDLNNVTDMFTLNWGLSTESTPLLIQYSLRYNYSHSQGNILINTIDNIANFSLLSSSAQTYTQSIAPHSFTCATDVETSVVACLRINEQCEQPSNAEICCSITSKTTPGVPTILPPTIFSTVSDTSSATLGPTTILTFTTTSGNESISAMPTMMASSPLIIAIIIIGLLLFTAVIIIVILLVVILYLARKIEQLNSTLTASKKAPSHPYEYIDIDEMSGNISSPTQQQSPLDYVPMSSVSKQDTIQPPTFYANLK